MPTDSLRAQIARALHGAHATMPWPAEDCGTCETLADAALAAIEASGTHMVAEVEVLRNAHAQIRAHGETNHALANLLAARPRDAAHTEESDGC